MKIKIRHFLIGSYHQIEQFVGEVNSQDKPDEDLSKQLSRLNLKNRQYLMYVVLQKLGCKIYWVDKTSSLAVERWEIVITPTDTSGPHCRGEGYTS